MVCFLVCALSLTTLPTIQLNTSLILCPSLNDVRWFHWPISVWHVKPPGTCPTVVHFPSICPYDIAFVITTLALYFLQPKSLACTICHVSLNLGFPFLSLVLFKWFFFLSRLHLGLYSCTISLEPVGLCFLIAFVLSVTFHTWSVVIIVGLSLNLYQVCRK